MHGALLLDSSQTHDASPGSRDRHPLEYLLRTWDKDLLAVVGTHSAVTGCEGGGQGS